MVLLALLLAIAMLLALIVLGILQPGSGPPWHSAVWAGDRPVAAEPGAPTRDIVLTADSYGGTVTVFDAVTRQRLRQIDVVPDGREPHGIARTLLYPMLHRIQGSNFAQDLSVSPDGTTIFVARGYLGDVAAFDLASGSLLWRTPVSGLRADHTAVTLDGRRLFVAATTANKVEAFDTISGEKIGEFATGEWAHGMELSRDGSKVYNGSIGNLLLPDSRKGERNITVADTSSLRVEKTIPVAAGLRPFVVSDDGSTAYAQLSYFHGLVKIDLASGRETARLDLPVPSEVAAIDPHEYTNEAAHHGLAISGNGRTLCAAATVSDYVAIVDASTMQMTAQVPVGDEPGWAATSPDGRSCYVTERGPDSVAVIDYASGTLIDHVAVGDHPQAIKTARVAAGLLSN